MCICVQQFGGLDIIRAANASRALFVSCESVNMTGGLVPRSQAGDYCAGVTQAEDNSHYNNTVRINLCGDSGIAIGIGICFAFANLYLLFRLQTCNCICKLASALKFTVACACACACTLACVLAFASLVLTLHWQLLLSRRDAVCLFQYHLTLRVPSWYLLRFPWRQVATRGSSFSAWVPSAECTWALCQCCGSYCTFCRRD